MFIKEIIFFPFKCLNQLIFKQNNHKIIRFFSSTFLAFGIYLVSVFTFFSSLSFALEETKTTTEPHFLILNNGQEVSSFALEYWTREIHQFTPGARISLARVYSQEELIEQLGGTNILYQGILFVGFHGTSLPLTILITDKEQKKSVFDLTFIPTFLSLSKGQGIRQFPLVPGGWLVFDSCALISGPEPEKALEDFRLLSQSLGLTDAHVFAAWDRVTHVELNVQTAQSAQEDGVFLSLINYLGLQIVPESISLLRNKGFIYFQENDYNKNLMVNPLNEAPLKAITFQKSLSEMQKIGLINK